MSQIFITPVRSHEGSGGERNTSPPRISGIETPSNSLSSIEEMATDEASSGAETWDTESVDSLLPEGREPPELQRDDTRIEVESRYFRIRARGVQRIIETWDEELDMWTAEELNGDQIFIGRRIDFGRD